MTNPEQEQFTNPENNVEFSEEINEILVAIAAEYLDEDNVAFVAKIEDQDEQIAYVLSMLYIQDLDGAEIFKRYELGLLDGK